MAKKEEIKITALYERLSRDDEQAGESNSMLYAFIDRIEVHEATGGRTVYRQQNIDIHFNFIGNYYPPVETMP